MPTYLFAWNPQRWGWKDLGKKIEKLHKVGYVDDRWSSGNTKDLPSGSRFFLIRLGRAPKGIVGSGVTTSEPDYDRHWDSVKARRGNKALYVDVRFDFLSTEPLIAWEELQVPPFSSVHWGIQASGVRIIPRVADALERVWGLRTGGDSPFSPDEIDTRLAYPEGAKKTVMVNAYERKPQARAACIAHYGTQCRICGTVLEERYGKIAAGFIHVHHVIPLSKVEKEYKVNPIKDLVPVCPTCHAIIHLRTPPLSVDEVRKLFHRSK